MYRQGFSLFFRNIFLVLDEIKSYNAYFCNGNANSHISCHFTIYNLLVKFMFCILDKCIHQETEFKTVTAVPPSVII